MMKLMVIYFIIKLFAQINYLKRTNFCVYLFSQAKKKNRISRVLIFANGKFLKISRGLIFANGKFLKNSSL